MLGWSHGYFGARGAGWAADELWAGMAGQEWICADPLRVPLLEDFAEHLRIAPQASSAVDTTASGPASVNCSGGRLLKLPNELIHQVYCHLTPRDVTSLSSTCRQAARQCDRNGVTIWRHHTLRLHGDWLWELADTSIFPANLRWKTLLRDLEMMRREVYANARLRRPARDRQPLLENTELLKRVAYRYMLVDEDGRRILPLGVRNRFRIWCCIASFGKDGRQINLPGQVAGVENVAEPSNGCACPLCSGSGRQ